MMKRHQWAALALSSAFCAAAAAYPTGVLGSAAPADSATRVVALTPSTHSVDVAFGETVAFEANGQRAAWQFYTPARSFDLNQVLPALGQSVKVFVGPDLKNNE